MHSTIPRLEKEVEEAEHRPGPPAAAGTTTTTTMRPMLRDAVDKDAIATVVSRATGIPVDKVSGSDRTALLRLEDRLRRRVVGQDGALSAVADCVRVSRTHLGASDRTRGNFLFLGPTGVGKTELCKALAGELFNTPEAMTRIDMSEYAERHTVSRLVGAPPGYVGYDEGGRLTESVRRRPHQVLLLDEFEKAHKDVWNVLLQLFDDGRLTDGHGRTVDFRNVIVVATSNMGAEVIASLPEQYLGSEPEVKESVMEIVRRTLPPELLNRIDETIVFNRLQRNHMGDILDIHLKEIQHRLTTAQNLALDISDVAKDRLADEGYDVRYGARPLKRVLNKRLLNPLSRLVLEGGLLRDGGGEADQSQHKDSSDDDDDEEVVKVRTVGEVQGKPDGHYGWIGGEDKNDVVILRNRDISNHDTDDDDDDERGENHNSHPHQLHA